VQSTMSSPLQKHGYSSSDLELNEPLLFTPDL
jgi:hypothetical protein